MRLAAGEAVMESLGFGAIAVGVGAVAALLLSRTGRHTAARWATRLKQGVADIFDEARGASGLIAAGAAVAAAGATIVAAPEAAGAAAATAPAAAATVPLVLEGLDRAAEAHALVEKVLRKPAEKRFDDDQT